MISEPPGNVREVHVKLLNSAIKIVKSPELGLIYGRVAENTLHLGVYTDASLGTNDDLTSQLGFLVLLCDADDYCHILDFLPINASGWCGPFLEAKFMRSLKSL